MLIRYQYQNTSYSNGRLTFQKLLASILLEEGFVCQWSMKVVKHQLKDRLDLFFGEARVLSQSGILYCWLAAN